MKELERENRELRRANEILRKASAFFAQAELDRRREVMVAFIDEHRDDVRSRADLRACCRSLRRRTTRTSAQQRIRRAGRRGRSATTIVRAEIQRVWDANQQVYGAAQGLAAAAARERIVARAAPSSA